jgi:type II secretory pathway predicted ATPase ExeA
VYEEFFRLRSRPFLTVPDPDFLYWSEAHMLAFTMLRYGLMTRAPLTVITGEIGAGKTTLLRKLLQEVPQDLDIGLISNMQAGRGELLHWVMLALGEDTIEDSYVRLFARFQKYVIDSYAAGRRVALVFDEAQNLDIDTLEELRMLSNINSDKDELLQIILLGQPQLRDLIDDPRLVQFRQRISADFHLDTMSVDEVENYITHRLNIAGANWRIFPYNTCRLIHSATRGVPRLVNILCDVLLVYAYSADEKVVSERTVREFLSSSKSRNIFGQFDPIDDELKVVDGTR